MPNLNIPKECPRCKGTDIWWTNDEVESVQAVELEDISDEED